MSDTIFDRLGRIAGHDAVRREPGGIARVTPDSTAAVAGILGVAHDEGWRVAVEGSGTWRTEDAPADVVLSLGALDAYCELAADRESVTLDAGMTIGDLRRYLTQHGLWLPLDPPGRSDRTLGSIIATGTSGPLQTGFGEVSHRLAGLTIATGDGRVALTGPGGFHAGGFGAFGVITRCSLLVEPAPAIDLTWIASGDRESLVEGARDIAAEGIEVAAAELFSPAFTDDGRWLLAIRLVGETEVVFDQLARLPAITGLEGAPAPDERHAGLWASAARAITTVPITVRARTLPVGIDTGIDLLSNGLGQGMQSVSVLTGAIRWSGVAHLEALRRLRNQLAEREIPLTLERAPWRVSRALGHFGPYRERPRLDVAPLRQRYDPAGVFVTTFAGDQEP